MNWSCQGDFNFRSLGVIGAMKALMAVVLEYFNLFLAGRFAAFCSFLQLVAAFAVCCRFCSLLHRFALAESHGSSLDFRQGASDACGQPDADSQALDLGVAGRWHWHYACAVARVEQQAANEMSLTMFA